MRKINKKKGIISSILILLPAVVGLALWNKLPDSIATHWGFNGVADGFSSKPVAVFLLPFILLAIHWLCLYITIKDPKQKMQSDRVFDIVYWIMPIISIFANGMTYLVASGQSYNFVLSLPLLIGILFIFMGNMMPKIRQNHTLGIKLYWTLISEENWQKTHRFTGKVWVIGGFIMLISIFLPTNLVMYVAIFAFLISIVPPFIYSYCVHRSLVKKGVKFNINPETEKYYSKAKKISIPIVILIVIGIILLMISGDINTTFEDTFLKIDSSFWDGGKVLYEDIESVSYLDKVDKGMKVYGFNSFKLSLGLFQNELYGEYTAYLYNGCDECILIEISGDNTLLLNGKTVEDTKDLYELLNEKVS